VAVAEHRHFGRAAEACFVSQPTLSTQIKKLETELGVDLVERNPRQVMLTPAGERVVERARIMLEEADDIRGIARQATDPESGTCGSACSRRWRRTCSPTWSPRCTPGSPTSSCCSWRRRPRWCWPDCGR
jgi:DNA-binding transcriptional LysR family regulator